MLPKRKSRLASTGAGLAAGAVLGFVAGLFFRSKQGKAVQKDVEKRALALQKLLLKRLETLDEVTEDAYDKAIDQVLSAYAKGKDVVKAELPELRTELRKRWKAVRALLRKAS